MINKHYEHVILVSLDTLRADCIESSPIAYNFKKKYKTQIKLNTECLDEIIAGGAYFNNCISAAPVTSVSHASYFTGLWPKKHGVYEYFNRKISKPTIFEFAQKAGYSTIFQTDFPIILGDYLGFDKGVDHYHIEDEAGALGRVIKGGDKKTFSFFHFGGIHYPYGFHTYKFGKEAYVNKIKMLEKKYHVAMDHEPMDIHDESFRNSRDKKLLSRYKAIIKKMYDGKFYDELFNLYLEGINFFIKNRLAKFLKDVKKFVDENNALLVIFSDHGEGWDENTHGHYNSLNDEVLRVPLIFYGKGVHVGKRFDLVRTIDLTPTIINKLSGCDYVGSFDGADLGVFDKGRLLEKKRLALAQFWYHGNPEKFIRHQTSVFKNKRLVKPMKTYLSKETAFGGLNRIFMSYSPAGELLARKNQVKKNEVFVETQSNGKIKELERFLKKYNKIPQLHAKKVKDVTAEIKRHLSDLGYNI